MATPSQIAVSRLKQKQQKKIHHEGTYEWDQHSKSDIFFSVAKEDVCKLFPKSPACSFIQERSHST